MNAPSTTARAIALTTFNSDLATDRMVMLLHGQPTSRTVMCDPAMSPFLEAWVQVTAMWR
jgi:hypothetical protein